MEGSIESNNNYTINTGNSCYGRFQACTFGAFPGDCSTYFGISVTCAPPGSASNCNQPNLNNCVAAWLSNATDQDINQRALFKASWSLITSNPAALKNVNTARVSAGLNIPFHLTQAAIVTGFNYAPAYVVQYVEGILPVTAPPGQPSDCFAASSNGGMCLSDYMAKNSVGLDIDDPWGINNPFCVDPLVAAGTGPPGGTGGGTGGGTTGGGTTGSCGPGTTTPPPPPPPPPCGNPALTGQWLTTASPCGFPGLPTNPGQIFINQLNNWWNNQFLPALKDMTSQLYSYRIFETWQLGRMMDAQDVNKAARVEQEQRVTAQQGASPDESTCVAGASPPPLAETALTATALTQGFKNDLARRSQNAIETPAGTPPSYAPPGMTPATDRSTRWTEYCNEFYDPLSNGGQNNGTSMGACPNPTQPPPGGILNGDISVEGFLLQDTINMDNPHEYAAAEALLTNLVQPEIEERLPDNIVTTPVGQEHIIRLQHLDAIKNIATDVISSIISRRAALPITPAPGQSTNVGQDIQDIRTKAGIPACPPKKPGEVCASKKPSYNEIMETMTKERFFDPEYFFRMQNNLGSLKQEQAGIDAYTTIELQDIYRLQEQINALLAARASLKLSTDTNNNQTPAAPMK